MADRSRSSAFISNPGYTEPFIGKSLAGEAAYPDWEYVNIVDMMWGQGLTELRTRTQFDGIWTPFNEVQTICDGNCTAPEPPKPDDDTVLLTDSFYPFDPTVPDGNPNGDDGLMSQKHSLPLDLRHYSSYVDIELFATELNLHNSFGALQSQISFNELIKAKDERPFIVTDSSTFGSGAHAGYVTGPNEGNWDNMKKSMWMTLNYNMYGMPLVGGNLCGRWSTQVDHQLCGRWHQAAVFSPLMVNDWNRTIDTDLYQEFNHSIDELEPAYQQMAVKAIK